MIFDDWGVCMGCRIHEEKDQLNWSLRWKKLEIITDHFKTKHGKKGYDCVIPVTGGGDSYFTVHVAKNLLQMNPLLVYYNSHFNTKIGIRNLANLTTVFDCDLVSSTLSPDLIKKITRVTLQNFGSMYWQVLAGYLTFPVQVSVDYKIPLVIWGVHAWSEQNGMYSHTDEVEMTRRCRKEHGLMGIDTEELLSLSPTLSYSDVESFCYPTDEEISRIGVRGIYLSNFIRWDSKIQHEFMINMFGYEPTIQQRTFNNYEDVHCFHSAGLHDYIKYTKFGYSKVTDHASREIRLHRMTRQEGIEQVKVYTEKEPKDLPLFLSWIEMDEKEFKKLAYNRRDPRIWNYRKSEWVLSDSVANHQKDSDKLPSEKKGGSSYYWQAPKIRPNESEKEYLLMGRGYIDKYNFGAHEDQPEGCMTLRKWKENKIY